MNSTTISEPTDSFIARHIGPSESDVRRMLQELGFASLDELIGATVPSSIRAKKPLALGAPRGETDVIGELRAIANKNISYRSFIGMGYSDCLVPAVIQRNILENPGWYTQYTPYQAEIAQGRLEALLNFQTMISDLSGLDVSNASLLDEATAAAEAMAMCFTIKLRDLKRSFVVASDCHPQTSEVVRTRARSLGISVVVMDPASLIQSLPSAPAPFAILLQYPGTDGSIRDYEALAQRAHAQDTMVIAAADLLGLAILRAPGEWGADLAVGSAQRFGVPMGFGGPHAAYLATRDEFKRMIPGRIVGLSKDSEGRPAARLALQTREQHIRRDKATSNICTAQVLLAIMSSMYAIYHGPRGVRRIAERTHKMAALFAAACQRLGHAVGSQPFFDTVRVTAGPIPVAQILEAAESKRINLRQLDPKTLTVSLDEATRPQDLDDLFWVFAGGRAPGFSWSEVESSLKGEVIPAGLQRKSQFFKHPVFNSYHSETEMLRYINRLQSRDLSLTSSMIPLGSCTMKLNATSEMLPVTWPEFSKPHPFAPVSQVVGYLEMIHRLERDLAEITGFAAVSLQPNAGSQGEFAGLLVIRAFHESKGESHRDVCLIPQSAHGTNPASAAMAGMRVVVVKTDPNGNIDLADMQAKVQEHAGTLGALMVTYPSTHGVFEEAIAEICQLVHRHGGQVYMDGANMNAQVGICRPGDYGVDVCHLNLHKTFCIPHGGGGPGMGPIGVQKHLAPFLPGHPVTKTGGDKPIGPVSAAPWGSASILTIPYVYIQMMGEEGLKRATQVAILNANYMAHRLEPHYPVLYKGKNGRVAHECIVDLRQLKSTSGVEVEDVAKRLMDYGFHSPTVSFPVAGTMMIEPTESESLREIDRFCEAMIAIREEIREIESGKADRQNNLLKNSPHTAETLTADAWTRPYARKRAAFPLSWVRDAKFWPPVSRIDSVYGDRNLVCSCPPMEEYSGTA